MHIEDEAVKIYFRYTPASMVLRGQIDYRHFPEAFFRKAMQCYMNAFSETESGLLYEYMRTKDAEGQEGEGNCLNVFAALVNLSGQLLVIRENQVKCDYQELERWRDITRYIGEDLPVCAYLARKSAHLGRKWISFQWTPVIGHTNAQLNAILKEGISENHFHLFGSAPVFQLIWVKLMNCVASSRYEKGLDHADHSRRMYHYHLDAGHQEIPLRCMILQAAFFRAVLFEYLTLEKDAWDALEARIQPILASLSENTGILDFRMQIQVLIDALTAEASITRWGIVDDYAQIDGSDEHNYIFTGERYLIYSLLLEETVKKKLPESLGRLFYAYLLIKNEIRAEFVQVNDTIGFENFSVYQKRKNDFLMGNNDLRQMVRCAVGSCFRSGSMRSLEIRITPAKKYKENARWIQFYDRIIESMGISKERYYYVYHLPKEMDRYALEDNKRMIPCRDAALRKKIDVWGRGIIQLREFLPETGGRIKGVDACSQEIGCRPEVFAPVFRRLQEHLSPFADLYKVQQLKQTFHVGEDFLDIVDGLRAIDEAILFLNMRNGDRLGHATVLGILPEEWYRIKGHGICVNLQDYLDNLVWLYHKLEEFGIENCEQLKGFLLKEFQDVFREIFAEHMDQNFIRRVCERSESLEQAGWQEPFFNIYTYYDAWKLRGDSPELYRNGYFQAEQGIWYDMRLAGNGSDELNHIRNNAAACLLYYYYHYDRDVRKCGKKVRVVRIPRYYIDGVSRVQKELQKVVGRLGIGIETNPSSNVLISTIMDYKEHPIINLYNMGIGVSEDVDCAQLFVSINTDDKGVFNTSLENEYALMASSLENAVDDNGRPKYNKQAVYQWLNNIRIMGNQQVFNVE